MGKQALDNYPTPQPLADAITKFCAELYPQKTMIIDPSCGAGNFLRPTFQFFPLAAKLGIDIVPEYQPYIEQLGIPFVYADFLQYAAGLAAAGWLGPQTLVLTNPPYGQDLPQRFIEEISKVAQPGCHIAFLLRQAFLGGVGRALKFVERKSLRVKRDIAGRPKFDPTSKTQDHSEYAVFIYEVGYRGHYIGWEDPLLWQPQHLAKQEKLLNPKPKRTRKPKAAA